MDDGLSRLRVRSTVNAFDLNSIPLGAVERIEIVSDSTSAIYGADAIGGVVNIVLRENIPEPRLDIDYGAADGRCRRAACRLRCLR